jgi:hypothetical protein
MNRIGRLQKLIRRMLIAANGKPVRVGDVLRRCYPGTTNYTWHYLSLHRARGGFAVPVRHGWLGPNEGLARLIGVGRVVGYAANNSLPPGRKNSNRWGR